VALDLGIVILRRAQGLADPDARRQELERAEKTFLAVRGVAGESDQYRLYLGQVYYWLGKHAEGRKLFDELLAAKQRNGDILLAVGKILREVGSNSEARALVEEAYNAATENDKKYQAAGLRAVMATERDDEITWLGRANPNDAQVKAMLSSAQGSKAMEDGKDEEAARHFRQAIDLYGKMPETTASLNNGALVYFALFRVTGDRKAFDTAVARLDRALALQPSDSILLMNASHSVMNAALQDIIGTSIDLTALRMDGSLELLGYLYKDPAGRDKLVQRVRNHTGIARALSYLDRLLTLSPKSPDAYHTLAAHYRFVRDSEAQRSLLQRMEGVELDLSDVRRRTLDFYSGKEDARLRKEFETRAQRYEAIVKEGPKPGKETTFAVAACSLVRARMTLDMMSVPFDPDALVKLAEQAHKAAPSQATTSSLLGAWLARAARRLEQQEPDYAALSTKARRSLGSSYLVAIALDQEGKLSEAVRADPDVRRAVAFHRETMTRFPDEANEWSWAFLRLFHPEDAAAMEKTLAQDKCLRQDRELDLRMDLYSAAVAYRAYWSQAMAGQGAKGQEILKQWADRGVPLP
jgi:tetratricopeptide (TPR) repeat protein